MTATAARHAARTRPHVGHDGPAVCRDPPGRMRTPTPSGPIPQCCATRRGTGGYRAFGDAIGLNASFLVPRLKQDWYHEGHARLTSQHTAGESGAVNSAPSRTLNIRTFSRERLSVCPLRSGGAISLDVLAASVPSSNTTTMHATHDRRHAPATNHSYTPVHSTNRGEVYEKNARLRSGSSVRTLRTLRFWRGVTFMREYSPYNISLFEKRSVRSVREGDTPAPSVDYLVHFRRNGEVYGVYTAPGGVDHE